MLAINMNLTSSREDDGCHLVPAVNGTYSSTTAEPAGDVGELEVGGTTAAPTAVSDAYSTPVNTH